MKKFVPLSLAVALVLPMAGQSVAATMTDFSDGVAQALELGMLRGDDGRLYPDRALSRAELSAMIVRLLAPKNEADLSKFSDVKESDWFKKDMAKAVSMGLMKGTDETHLAPEKTMSREEVATVLYRLMKATESDVSVLGKLSDEKSISPWARDAVAALLSEGILAGDGARIRPKDAVTRGEFATLMNRVFPNVVKADTSNATYKGRTLILPGVTSLKNVTFEGDVVLADGVEGTVLFEGCTVKGKVISRGGTVREEKAPVETPKVEAPKTATPVASVLPANPYFNLFQVYWPVVDKKPDPTPEKPGVEKEEIVRYASANVDQQQYPLISPFIHPPFYNARVKVVLDKDNRIVSVSDDDTATKGFDPSKTQEFWERKNGKFWRDYFLKSSFFDKLKGKSREEVAALEVEHGKPDALTGATETGKAVRQAVLNAMDGKDGKKFLPPEQTLTASEAIYPKGTTSITFKNTLPKDFALKLHSVYAGIYNAEGEKIAATLEGDTLTVPDNLAPGHYYVNIVDESETYRSPDFESGHGTPRHYPHFVIAQAGKLSFEDNKLKVSEGDLAPILANIEEIEITPKDGGKTFEIEPVGHHGTMNAAYKETPLFKADGSIDVDAKRGRRKTPVFEEGKTYDIVLHVWGYEEPLSFTFTATGLKEVVRYASANVDQQQYPLISPFIHPPFYNARVKVVLDKDNRIVSVSDDDTATKGFDPSKTQEFWERKNGSFWKDYFLKSGLFDKLKGKTREEVAALQMEHGQPDAVTGATESGKAVRQAVLNAMDGKEGKKFLPPEQTLTASEAIYPKGTTSIDFTNTLPEGFKLKLHSVYAGIYNGQGTVVNATLEGNTLTVPGDLAPGHYYVNIVDESETYRSPDFESGHGTPRHYPHFVIAQAGKLSFEDNKLKVSEGDLAPILANIEEIEITPKDGGKTFEIEPVGHHGTADAGYKETPLFKADGSIDVDAKRGRRKTPVFEEGKEYEITLHVWGYKDPLTFNFRATGLTPGEITPKPTASEQIGSAPVEGFGYNVEVLFSYENDVVKSLRDHGTKPGDSDFVWNGFLDKHKALFEGKSKAEIEKLDIDTMTEVTAKATGKALKKAILEGK